MSSIWAVVALFAKVYTNKCLQLSVSRLLRRSSLREACGRPLHHMLQMCTNNARSGGTQDPMERQNFNAVEQLLRSLGCYVYVVPGPKRSDTCWVFGEETGLNGALRWNCRRGHVREIPLYLIYEKKVQNLDAARWVQYSVGMRQAQTVSTSASISTDGGSCPSCCNGCTGRIVLQKQMAETQRVFRLVKAEVAAQKSAMFACTSSECRTCLLEAHQLERARLCDRFCVQRRVCSEQV